MTKLLTKVIQQIEELPEERQNDAAHVLMTMLEDPKRYHLTDAQLRQVDKAIADVDAGNFARDEEIERALYRPWG